MRHPQFYDDGSLREITRIEFEPMGEPRFRFTLWSGDVRMHSEVGDLETLAGFLEATAIFCGGMAYVKKANQEEREARKTSKPRTGSETNQVSRRLDRTDR